MKIAIVGAGWAGLAAASHCQRAGAQVTLYEAGHKPGGRARGVDDPVLGDLDNGQHLLIGAYQATLELMRLDMGPEATEQSLLRQPLLLQSVDGAFEMRVNTKLAPRLQNAAALWLAKGLSLKDKWRTTVFLQGIKSGANHPKRAISVTDWLASHHQTRQTCQWLWYPLCLATMNTDPDQACAQLFCKVVSDSLLNPTPGATDFLLPRQNLSAIWPNQVASRVNARWGHAVRHAQQEYDGVTIDGEKFDACVLAVPPPNLKRIIEHWTHSEELIAILDRFEFRPITTCYMALDNQLTLPQPIMMFPHGSDSKSLGQWVIDRSHLATPAPQAQLAFVVSNSSLALQMSEAEIGQALLDQLTHALSLQASPKIKAVRCFHEKRATFAALPGQSRPQTRTPWPRIVLAGDWTDTGYPAVIEGAVRSGIAAATALLQPA